MIKTGCRFYPKPWDRHPQPWNRHPQLRDAYPQAWFHFSIAAHPRPFTGITRPSPRARTAPDMRRNGGHTGNRNRKGSPSPDEYGIWKRHCGKKPQRCSILHTHSPRSNCRHPFSSHRGGRMKSDRCAKPAYRTSYHDAHAHYHGSNNSAVYKCRCSALYL